MSIVFNLQSYHTLKSNDFSQSCDKSSKSNHYYVTIIRCKGINSAIKLQFSQDIEETCRYWHKGITTLRTQPSMLLCSKESIFVCLCLRCYRYFKYGRPWNSSLNTTEYRLLQKQLITCFKGGTAGWCQYNHVFTELLSAFIYFYYFHCLHNQSILVKILHVRLQYTCCLVLI